MNAIVTSAAPMTWAAALADFNAKAAYLEALPPGSPDDDDAVDAECAAMDHLVENVRAADGAGLLLKLKLGRQRFSDSGFPMPEEWMDAFAADVRSLIGGEELAAGDPETVPDVHFEPAFSGDEAVSSVREVIPSFGQQLTQMFMLLALDRPKMDDFFGGLSEDDAVHTLQVCNDTLERAEAVAEMARTAMHRALVSAGAKCGMLSGSAAA